MALPSSSFSILLFISLLLVVADGTTAQLETDSLLLTVDVHCAEGNVICASVTLQAIHKGTGASLILNGETLHTRCADGITPCRFIGYHFGHHDLVYQLTEQGVFSVLSGSDTVFEEAGTWLY
ncbi:MAG: hypothetical protein WD572_06430 [Gammaproteobacteria bacterium]